MPVQTRSRPSMPPTPLFFKLWFGFILLGVLAIFCGVGYSFYTAIALAHNPEELGAYAGRILKGYEQAK